MAEPYDPQKIEPTWQEYWARERFAAAETAAEKDLYMLMMFPYPSGDLHVGHGRNYILGDCLFRHVPHAGAAGPQPDGVGRLRPARRELRDPAQHPPARVDAREHRAMKEQFQAWGVLYDWTKEVTTCEPEYYRWNQWLFNRCSRRGSPTAARHR